MVALLAQLMVWCLDVEMDYKSVAMTVEHLVVYLGHPMADEKVAQTAS